MARAKTEGVNDSTVPVRTSFDASQLRCTEQNEQGAASVSERTETWDAV